DAAAVAADALVLRALVLAARALVVAFGSEDALAEEAVFLGAVGAAVEGLGLLRLAEGPRTDVVRGREGDAHRGEVIDAVVHALSHVGITPAACGGRAGEIAARRISAGRRG